MIVLHALANTQGISQRLMTDASNNGQFVHYTSHTVTPSYHKILPD